MQIHQRTSRQRHHPTVQIPIHSVILLHQKERWQTTTRPRLSPDQQLDDKEQIPTPTHSTTCRLSQRMLALHKVRHPLGLQQRPYQRGRRMESSLHDQQRLIRTYGYVLRSHKFTGHIPNNDELSLRTGNCRTMAYDIYGRFGNTHGETPRRNGSTTSPTAPRTGQTNPCKTSGAQPLPETGKMHFRTTDDRIPRGQR